MYPKDRMRRLRRNEAVRRLTQETVLRPESLVLPVFVVPGRGREEPVAAMPGVVRLSVDLLSRRAERLGVGALLVFGVPGKDEKDETGAAALRESSAVPSALRALKAVRPELLLITDVCVCSYTSHGHCGLVTEHGDVDNDRTLSVLGQMAAVHAAAGADMVAPSAMMDGQVKAIREVLDGSGCVETAIMAYSAKFASCYYGPFRDAAGSAPLFGDRRSYQLAPSNRREAVRDALLDEAEGADWLMVKPALPYLDVVAELRSATRLPVAAYQVSGEYAMLKHAAARGALLERDGVLESVLCIKRAGADAIITYYAEELCQWLGA